MRILVPHQPAGERRVPLTPEVVGRMTADGHEVLVAGDVGQAAGYPDQGYRDAGASVVGPEEGWDSDLVVTLAPPGHPVTTGMIGLLDPFGRPDRLAELAAEGAMLFAFEAVPRTTRAQTLDALTSQATVAGYRAVLEAAVASPRLFPLITTAAGTIRPAQVLVVGAGVAGLQAIATARRLGAVVSAFDVRAAAAEHVESLGARFVHLEVEPQDASASGGYARALEPDAEARIAEGLAPHVAAADVVITAAAVPGGRAPVLIDDPALEAMTPGSVVVDLSASTGGNTTRTVDGSTVEHAGVQVIGAGDLASKVAKDASRLYARNVAAFVDLVTDDENALSPDWDDDIVAAMCVARSGEVVGVTPGSGSPAGDPA